jgi:hypothetical protein
MRSGDRQDDTRQTKGRRVRRSILLCIGWLAAGAGLAYSVTFLWIDWNLFDFHPTFDATYAGLVAAILIAMAACAGLAIVSKDWGSRIVSLLVCLSLIALGVCLLPPDRVTHGLLGRSTPTPLWFRGGMAMTLSLPFAFWLRWPLHFWLRSRRERQAPQPPAVT